MTAPLLDIAGLSKHYGARGGRPGWLGGTPRAVRAVSDISLQVMPGEVLGLVGESGSGKSTLGRLALLLEPPSEGRVLYDGADPLAGGAAALQRFRGEAQMVFQDPQSSLNRSLSISRILDSPLSLHARGLSRRQRAGRVAELLVQVGLRPELAARYPHELSGGQRQRVGIARALAVAPRFLVLDEPTSALDVSIQAQVANLLVALQEQLALTYVFISHDLRLVRWLCDRIAVMYLGRIVEMAPAETLWSAPRHPYTRALLSAVSPGGHVPLAGETPSPLALPPGCAFAPRCPSAGARCGVERPELRDGVACHLEHGGVG
jgi:oligopeptide/dipeptide ABC transporter ATP-binding protein